jgi:hypothetical protein
MITIQTLYQKAKGDRQETLLEAITGVYTLLGNRLLLKTKRK